MFGSVQSKSKKTARSKGYGWIEFEEEEVAKIAAETMDGYLMFGRKLVCKLVPRDQVHPQLFRNHGRKMVNFTFMRRSKARADYNNRPFVDIDGEMVPRATENTLKNRKRRVEKLEELLKRLEVNFDPDEALEGGITAPASPKTQLSKKMKAQDSQEPQESAPAAEAAAPEAE